MVSMITKNTMIDTFENPNYVRVVLYGNEYHIDYDYNVERVKGKGVNDLYRYQATKMAIDIISTERNRRKRF